MNACEAGILESALLLAMDEKTAKLCVGERVKRSYLARLSTSKVGKTFCFAYARAGLLAAAGAILNCLLSANPCC
jgi:hypothetical protein